MRAGSPNDCPAEVGGGFLLRRLSDGRAQGTLEICTACHHLAIKVVDGNVHVIGCLVDGVATVHAAGLQPYLISGQDRSLSAWTSPMSLRLTLMPCSVRYRYSISLSRNPKATEQRLFDVQYAVTCVYSCPRRTRSCTHRQDARRARCTVFVTAASRDESQYGHTASDPR